ncbi:YbdD/YjiX family protein [Agilicoccus flavus]|uniref:YbdD/YjiX family protein n=1 Tax=Agilicoccus flavus TaxID=2775968 RepID=UPI001CF6ED6C|nr:YbdD/YjiX family protein [Agilicoccus flavus]
MTSGAAMLGRARRVASSLRWYVRGVVGEDAYDRYVAHLRATHPDAPIPTEREFWREKYAEQERNPKTRCC